MIRLHAKVRKSSWPSRITGIPVVIKSHDNTVTEACHVTRQAKMADKT